MTIIPDNLAIHKPKKELLDLIEKNDIKERILETFESDFHSISVVESKIGRFLKYDDTYQAGYIDTPFYKGNLPYINYFLIPLLMSKKIKDVLFIGFGSGIIVNQYEEFLNLKTVDIVDIEENIFYIAQKYFNFRKSDKQNFILQDALIYLKTTKKKYDLIIVDVAGNEGIDERFCDSEYLNLIQNKLKKEGIFVSNMPSSRDIFNPKNKFALELIEMYKKYFEFVYVYNGEQSNKIFYKTFFDIDEVVFDVTNLILISSNKKYSIEKNDLIEEKFEISKYLNDLCNFHDWFLC